MSIVDFIALCMAADAVLSVWFQGSIFTKSWNRAFRWAETGGGVRGFFGELLTCKICFSYHAPFWPLLLLLFVPSLFLQEPWSTLLKVPMYSLAATDAVQWLQWLRPWPADGEEDVDESSD